jgi:hypothetical protein
MGWVGFASRQRLLPSSIACVRCVHGDTFHTEPLPLGDRVILPPGAAWPAAPGVMALCPVVTALGHPGRDGPRANDTEDQQRLSRAPGTNDENQA